MTDTQPRPDGTHPWGYPPPPRPVPGPAAPWTQQLHPPRPVGSPPPVGPPPPPRPRKPRTALRVLLILVAVVVGIPGALLVAGVIAVLAGGSPSSGRPTPTPVAAPSATAPAEPTTAAPSPPPEPDPLDPYDLAAGDCYNAAPLPPDGSTVRISSVEPVPCTQPHTAQVVARFTYTDVTWSDATNARSEADCQRSFRASVSTKVLRDQKYRPGRIHSTAGRPGPQSLFSACVIATDAPSTGSVLKG